MHILILGAGYAGLHVALELDRLRTGREDLLHITLVDRNLYHQHTVLLHLTATGANNETEAAIPLDTILQGRAIRFYQGEVTRIEPLQRRVLMHDGLSLGYDRLVIALGGQTNYAGVPGASEHTWPLRSYDEAVRLREHIKSCFRQAARSDDPAARRMLLTFVIVGGGFTGCQLAGELEALASKLCCDYGLARREVRIALLERSDALIKPFGTWASAEAQRVLEQRGISIHLNMQVERAIEQTIFVAGGKRLSAATVIWTAGIRAPHLLAESGLTDDAAGRISVDRYLRGTGPDQALIFAIGDCARVPDPLGGHVPTTASYALRQGEHLAASLLAEATGGAPSMYEPQRLGQLVSFGPGEAVGKPLGVPISGLSAALLKQAVEKWYLTTLS
jgi:NADH dehydrogenase